MSFDHKFVASAMEIPSLAPSRQLSCAELLRIVPHVFLPRKLPGVASDSLFLDEGNMLNLLSDTINDVANVSQNQHIHKVGNMFSIWAELQQHEGLTPDFLSEAISSLKPGDSLPLYIRAQNAGFLLSIPDDTMHDSETAILSTFPACPKLEDVMTLPGDLAAIYPTSSIHIPISQMLASDTIDRQLTTLCVTQSEVAMPKRKKGRFSRDQLQDVADPLLISRLITGILSNEESEACPHFKTISKVIRDAVISNKGKGIPFRRSGLWMTAKVILQLSFVNRLDKTNGVFLYKMIMLKLMASCCRTLAGDIDTDVGMQMLAKVARRVRKLEQLYANSSLSEELSDMYIELQGEVIQSTEMMKNRLNAKWEMVVHEDNKRTTLRPLPILNFKDDTKHLLKASKSYLSPQNQRGSIRPDSIRPPKCPPRHYSASGHVSEFPLHCLDTDGEEELGIVLCDFEIYVRRSLKSYASVGNCQSIRKLLEKYVRKAKTYYINDPVGSSRMILTAMQIVQILDELAIGTQPLLNQHESGVNIDIISDLLLPQSEDMKIAFELEKYFTQRNKATGPSLISEQTPSQASFSSVYAKTDNNMIMLRHKILREAESRIAAKKAEAQRGRTYCDDLRLRASQRSHDSMTRNNRYGLPYTFHPKRTCTKCSLENQADRYRIGLYERPLPTKEYEQHAVVFELLVPQEIACLRDSLFFFITEVCSAGLGSRGSTIHTLWKSYNEVSYYYKGTQEHVNLGTTAQLTMSSYSSRSPEHNTDDQFIVENGFNCRYSANNQCLGVRGKANIKNICSFNTDNNPLYKEMDKWLKNTSHNQNEVIAKQSECPHDMSLLEFKEFGSLRAGHRLQLRNIYRSLQQETLSFHREPVFNLICQSIWQAGPASKQDLFHRESHEDLRDSNFAMALLDLLDKVRAQQSKNWTNYYIMLVVIVLTTRTLSLCKNDATLKAKALDLLLKCREVGNCWADSIEAVLSKTSDFPKDKVDELRMNLMNVSMCAALTYWVDENSIPCVMKDSTALESWLKAIARIKDNIILSTSGVERLTIPLRNLLRCIRIAGVKMESHIHGLLQQDATGLQEFTRSHWHGSTKGTVGPWKPCDGSEKQVYQSYFVNHEGAPITLHVDVIRGNFLMNTCPVGHLPSAITGHKDYHRVFSNIIFEVQPAPAERGTYITALEYHKSSYSFMLHNSLLVVTETQENDDEYQLVPHHIFNGDLPFLLINNYSHWWNKKNNTVSFRPVSFSHKEFQTEVKYILDLATFKVVEVATGSCVIDINSNSYLQICTIAGRMEHFNYMLHMLMKLDGKAVIDFPRMDLHFEINQRSNGEVELLSLEYPGMKVSKKQKFGTLIGLNQGLYLISPNPSFAIHSIYLIPHGNVDIRSGLLHQNVKIDLAQLHKPEYFAFEVDDRLRELRAGQSLSGWTYLALLHAATASPLPDPFTSMTGTEAALRLLQSPRCWSCQPLNEEVTKILKAISQLSPVRKYHPSDQNQAEHVQWPSGVSSLCAHDGYQMIVQSLLKESEKLSFLYQTSEATDDTDDTDLETDDSDSESKKAEDKNDDYGGTLAAKSYWRHRFAYTEQGQVNFESELKFLSLPPPTTAVTTFVRDLDDSILQRVRTIAHLGHVWESITPLLSSSGYLIPLLISESGMLNGVTEMSFYPVDIMATLSLNFKQSWLDLYVFAKRVKEWKLECEWTMLLSTLAFKDIPFEQLKFLHCIAVNPEMFRTTDPPSYVHYLDCKENDFNSSVINRLFQSQIIPFDEYEARTGKERKFLEEEHDYEVRKRETLTKYNSLVSSQVSQLTQMAQSQWPAKSCIVPHASKASFTEIRLDSALMSVNEMLHKWFMNLELKLFLQKVEDTVFKLESVPAVLVSENLTQTTGFPERCQRERFFELTLEELSDRCDDVFIDDETEKIFVTGYLSSDGNENDVCTINLKSEFQQNPSKVNFPWEVNSSCKIGSAYMQDTKKSWNEYHKRPKKFVAVDPKSTTLVEQLERQHLFYSQKAKAMWSEITKILNSTDNFEKSILMSAGLLPRITPITVLPHICKESTHEVNILFGATAVLWTLEQRANRCLKYIKSEGGPMEVALKKELATRGHENWSPHEHPEWLLLELEMDLMIRPVQVDVANAMLKPEHDKHAVMQLNMGEGKTTVIIPMVVATLSNGEQLCRVTVLKSLFQMNRDALAFKLGGLLSRRVYTLPCRRDMTIGSNEAHTMIQVYKECKEKHGVVLTLPEYRLSFELKGYEKSSCSNYEDARSLLEVQHWLKENARDLLDESDEILHVKYQLVYTIGEQLLVGGGKLRWTVAQSLLKLVPYRLENLLTQINNAAECKREKKHPERFPHCRLLNLDSYQQLCGMLADDVLCGNLGIESLDFTTEQKPIVKQFLTNDRIEESVHEAVLHIFDTTMNSSKLDILLILRGLLACGVLSLVLNKRFRVNFGVNPNGTRCMAVPFRAKDVAAERTEFGHPDVAILCTILSYYYSGLSQAQLDQCFEILYLQQNCVEEYERWISSISNIHLSIKKLSGINLADYEQRVEYLYPVLLKNMVVIDFWLDKVVFPKEAKQFGYKMTCSAWDLCSDEASLPVTGFSGTNDSKLLLPLSISQKDLPQLIGTSGEVLNNLLLAENNNYGSLSSGTTNEEVLDLLVEGDMNLLLDVGALMIDLSNKQLAQKWLEKVSAELKDAAIYFNLRDELVVTDRKGRTTLLALSPYRGRMDKCIIYLDDFHTRGTDLKIPRGTKGCVTLGKGITKDKLVQGCMRMRMLGEGHTVCFLASKEVDIEIRNLCEKPEEEIETKDVLAWAMENSRVVTRDGFVQWTASGFNYIQKKAAHILFDKRCTANNAILKLGERCADEDVIELKKMYGTVRKDVLFQEIAQNSLKFQVAQFSQPKLMPDELPNYSKVSSMLHDVGAKIVNQCMEYVPDFKRASALLDEEQERELERELEEEREIHRPRAAEPAKPALQDEVIKFVTHGLLSSTEISNWAVKLPLALKTTSLWPKHVQEDCWGRNIYATNDFVNVINTSYVRAYQSIFDNRSSRVRLACTDDFLRSPTWIAAVTKHDTTTLLILSPFEVNSLMPIFRSGQTAAVLHMYAARLHPDQDSLFKCHQLAVPSTVSVSFPEYNILNANLSLFSGNLYFEDKEEQDVYIRFLGLIPQPRTDEEQKVFDNGQTCSGFVPPDCRDNLPHITSPFKLNPSSLVRGIIDKRLDYFPSLSHVSKVIMEAVKPFDYRKNQSTTTKRKRTLQLNINFEGMFPFQKTVVGGFDNSVKISSAQ